MTDSRVHLCPPAGSALLPCCDRTVDQIPDNDPITTYAHEVTCTDRKVAELVVDTDDGDSPFGWREDTVRDRAPALAAALCAVRRQCAQWARPTSALTWDARNRDLGVAVAVGVLVEIIDRLAPGLDDPDPDEAAQRPGLLDRFATVLATTLRADCTHTGPHNVHGPGGHTFDGRCALCSGDIEALATALTEAVTRTPLPHLGGL